MFGYIGSMGLVLAMSVSALAGPQKWQVDAVNLDGARTLHASGGLVSVNVPETFEYVAELNDGRGRIELAVGKESKEIYWGWYEMDGFRYSVRATKDADGLTLEIGDNLFAREGKIVIGRGRVSFVVPGVQVWGKDSFERDGVGVAQLLVGIVLLDDGSRHFVSAAARLS